PGSGPPTPCPPRRPRSSRRAPERSRASAPHRDVRERTAVGLSPPNTYAARTATLCRSARPRTAPGAHRYRRSLPLAVELGREESRRRLQDLIRPAQLLDFTLKLLDPSRLGRGHPRPIADINLDLAH